MREMRLAIADTAGWSVTEVRPGLWRATCEGEPALAITFGPMVPVVGDGHAWAQRVLAEQVPAGARVEVARDRRTETRDGWALAIVDSTVVQADGSTVEARRTGIYTALQHGAAAVARAPTADAIARHGDAIDAFFASGAPAWASDACTIEQLLAGALDEAPR